MPRLSSKPAYPNNTVWLSQTVKYRSHHSSEGFCISVYQHTYLRRRLRILHPVEVDLWNCSDLPRLQENEEMEQNYLSDDGDIWELGRTGPGASIQSKWTIT
jgi:hypothetical protein